MVEFSQKGISPSDSDPDPEELLRRYDAYIRNLAWKKVPRNVVRPEMLFDEIEDLAQVVRIKLWDALQQQHIEFPKAYINSIMYRESVNIARRHKRAPVPLPIGEDGELYQGNVMIGSGEGMQDPAYEVEQKEIVSERAAQAAKDIVVLPPRQQYATISSLKEKLDDTLLVIKALKERGVDTDVVSRPATEQELQRQRASLTIARKKLRH